MLKDVVFTTKFNPRGPNVKNIIKSNLHIIENQPEIANLFPSGSIFVANKKENNLKDLLLQSDPYNIKEDLKLHLHLYRFLATTRKNYMNRNFTLN